MCCFECTLFQEIDILIVSTYISYTYVQYFKEQSDEVNNVNNAII